VVAKLEKRTPHRIAGTAVLLTGSPGSTPTALLHNLKHNKVLHEQNVILSVVTEDAPRVDERGRATVETLSQHFLKVTLRFGFMEEPNVAKALPACRRQGRKFDVMSTSFFLSRRLLKPAAQSSMPAWQERLFLWLAGGADDASRYFCIPTARVVEIGTQVAV
jgi:KUP system potassium uptake protein